MGSIFTRCQKSDVPQKPNLANSLFYRDKKFRQLWKLLSHIADQMGWNVKIQKKLQIMTGKATICILGLLKAVRVFDMLVRVTRVLRWPPSTRSQ